MNDTVYILLYNGIIHVISFGEKVNFICPDLSAFAYTNKDAPYILSKMIRDIERPSKQK